VSSAGKQLRIGTRGSALAVWQTERVRALLAAGGFRSERVEIRTTGDLAPEVPLSRIGSRALFTKQIDDALLEQRVDLAVHSLKDLPSTLPAGIIIAAVAEREDARDALVARGGTLWEDLSQAAVIGTSSLRRRAQLLYHRPDLRIVDLRGNVDTRIAKLDANHQWAAIVLATAGLLRLGLDHRISQRLPPDLLVPAPGQGALGVTVRSGDEAVFTAVRDAVHHPDTAFLVAAERGFLARLEGGCQVPIGAYAEWMGTPAQRVVRLHGRVISSDGRSMIEGRRHLETSDEASARALGSSLAEELLTQGAGEILADARSSTPAISEP
jgi:hydroxymethylbilane synthase